MSVRWGAQVASAQASGSRVRRLLDQYDELQNRWDIGMMSMVNRLGSRLKPG